jgi:predicted DCC family thiol-disulfide oxidoreductase YuxK
MTSPPLHPLTVFYDGSCHLCSREMASYREQDVQGHLKFVDISAADFDPAPFDRRREDFMAQLHVRDAAGEFHLGVDAFPVIWQALPENRLRWLGDLIRLPGFHLLARLGYRTFARLRTYLPRRRDSCASGTCPTGHPRHQD